MSAELSRMTSTARDRRAVGQRGLCRARSPRCNRRRVMGARGDLLRSPKHQDFSAYAGYSGSERAPMPPMEWSLPAAFEVRAAAAPDRDMLVWKDTRRSYGQVATRTRSLASFLRRHGLGVRRERSELERWECGQATVALLLYNCPEYIEAMLGCFRARTVPFNVNQHYRPEEVRSLLDMLDADAVVYHRALAPLVAAAAKGRELLLVDVDDGSGASPLAGSTSFADAAREPVAADLPLPSPDDLCLVYTGGTTADARSRAVDRVRGDPLRRDDRPARRRCAVRCAHHPGDGRARAGQPHVDGRRRVRPSPDRGDAPEDLRPGVAAHHRDGRCRDECRRKWSKSFLPARARRASSERGALAECRYFSSSGRYLARIVEGPGAGRAARRVPACLGRVIPVILTR